MLVGKRVHAETRAIPRVETQIVDRHVPKNAGTSVRSMLQRNARAGACTFVGYDVSSTWRRAGSNGGFNHVAFSELLRRLRPGTRWCVEAHIVSDSFCELYRLSSDQMALLLDLFLAENLTLQLVARQRLEAARRRAFYDDAALLRRLPSSFARSPGS